MVSHHELPCKDFSCACRSRRCFMGKPRCPNCGDYLNSAGKCFSCDGTTTEEPTFQEKLEELGNHPPPNQPCPTCGGTRWIFDTNSVPPSWMCANKKCRNIRPQGPQDVEYYGGPQKYGKNNTCPWCGNFKYTTQAICSDCMYDAQQDN